MTTLLRNCNQHGVLAARLASERPGSVIRLSKEFTRLVVRTVKAFVTVEVFGTGKKNFVVRAQLSYSYQLATSSGGNDKHFSLCYTLALTT